jgi:hypothetical protein
VELRFGSIDHSTGTDKIASSLQQGEIPGLCFLERIACEIGGYLGGKHSTGGVQIQIGSKPKTCNEKVLPSSLVSF